MDTPTPLPPWENILFRQELEKKEKKEPTEKKEKEKKEKSTEKKEKSTEKKETKKKKESTEPKKEKKEKSTEPKKEKKEKLTEKKESADSTFSMIVDERETALMNIIQNQPSAQSHTIIKKVLHLGDIVIANSPDKEFVVLERKSISDLLASIKDGRYEEQSYRLIGAYKDAEVRPKICYIIEGSLHGHSCKEKQLVYSAMVSLSIGKGFHIIRTDSLNETADYLLYMLDKFERDFKKGKAYTNVNETEKKELGYETVVKKVKKENLTPENMGEIILSQIPSISSITASAIMSLPQINGSIPRLIHELEKNPLCLAEVRIGEKQRKISKTTVPQIIKYLLNQSSE